MKPKWIGIFLVGLLMLAASGTQALATMGPGRVDLPLIADNQYETGTVAIHNNNGGLLIEIALIDGWQMVELHVHAGWDENPVPMKNGNPVPAKFDFKYEYETEPPVINKVIFLDFAEDLEGFRWGEPYERERLRHIAVHVDIVQLGENTDGEMVVTAAEGAWAKGDIPFSGSQWGWWLEYPMTHKARTHFIDSPVEGLRMVSPTEDCLTDASGGADYFPGEVAGFYLGDQLLGTTLLDHKVSPLDLFPNTDLEDPQVQNMAMLLQSLDADADPKPGITLTPAVVACFNRALDQHDIITDWSDDNHVDAVVAATIANCSGVVDLKVVERDVAIANLDRSVNANMFRRRLSRTPDMPSAKAKLNIMGVWFPAKKANGDSATIEYFDEDGNLLRTTDRAKPLVATFTDADPDTGSHDVWAAVSRDDGHTWKRKNLSRMAYRSSFILANGEAYYGHCKKPVFHVKGNKILVAWTSKYARGGKPRYAIQTCPADEPDCIVCNGYAENEVCEPDYVHDDDYYTDDIWGVSGPQRSVDYAELGYPEVGEVPYSAVWVARGIIATAADVSKGLGDEVGDIVWFKPERLTSGRRDAYQVFMGGADGAGFAIAWQEDPGGLRPGNACGPGPGWGGATTNHKTDIWYSYVSWADFAKVDLNFVSGGDPAHDDPDFVGRPKALVPMSLPVRISDNDVVNTDNMFVQLGEDGLPVKDADGNFIPLPNPDTNSDDSDGSHRYGYMVPGLWDWDGKLHVEGEPVAWDPGAGKGTLHRFQNQQDETKTVVVTVDGRALDGNTGASRPNLFLQTYTKSDGTKSAWAIMAYEETKGMGSGPSEHLGEGDEPLDGSGYDPYATAPDEGKNVIYHSFDFQNPDLVSAGTIINLPETDADGTELYALEPDYLGSTLNADGTYTPIPNPLAGEEITDWKGDPIHIYENARRPRFILQGKSAAGASKTVLIVLYKEGQEGKGRPSDIMARRCVANTAGNPYKPDHFVSGVQNLSTVTPTVTWTNPDRDPDAKGDGVKVCRWTQPKVNLGLKSGANPYEDARAHRGQIRGDFVIMGYAYCPNWAASRNAHDKYDFYIRRSFDGGQTWTTDPAADVDVTHTDYFIDPEGFSGTDLTASPEAMLDEEGNDITEPTKHYTVDTTYGPGEYEPARNITLIKNNKTSVIEPRIVAAPGTIKKDGAWTGIAEDKQNRKVFYVAYGTSTNLPDVDKLPEDLFFSYSLDRGTTLEMDEWVVNPDSDGNNAGETVKRWFRLAKGEAEQGEVQIRLTPDGSRFYASWLDEGWEGSDIMFRRLMPAEFPANAGTTP
jgi:hypothetical protein